MFIRSGMLRQFRKKRPILLLTVIVTLLLTACDSGSVATPTVITGPAGGTTATAVAGAPSTPTTATNQPSGTTAATREIKNPDSLIVSTSGELATLDPAWAYDVSSAEVINNIYETLLTTNREDSKKIIPMLATKWDISSDGKTYTFNIRKGVKFQGGEDLTPEDVAYSFQRGIIQDRAGGPQWIMLQPLFGLSAQSFKGDVVDKQNAGDMAKGCEAIKQAVTFDNSAGTVTLHLAQPYGPMLQILTGMWSAVVSKSWVTKQGGWDGDCANAEKYHDPKVEESELFKAANGTGPYKLDRWAAGEQISLVRNDNYWVQEPLWAGGPTGPAKIKNVVIKYINEWGTRFAAFKAGDADIVYVDQQYDSQIDPLVKETCEYGKPCVQTNGNGIARLFKGLPAPANYIIGFDQLVNTTGGNTRIGSGTLDGKGIPPDFFADIHVRKAFNYCFDWDTLIKQTYNGEAEQNLGPIVDGELGYDPNQAHYSLDLGKCADEFKASTLKSPDGKSLWDTGFTMQYVSASGFDQGKTMGEILKANLSKVNPNFQLVLAEEPFAAEINDIVASNLAIYEIGWIEDFHDPHDWAFPYLASSGAYAGNQHFPKDLQTQFDDLIVQAVSAADPAERAKLYGQMQNMAYENAVNIFVIQSQARHYEQDWVKGWYYNPTYMAAPIPPGNYYYVLSKGY
jgi:peptide/nickel transport system substrate-binding protein